MMSENKESINTKQIIKDYFKNNKPVAAIISVILIVAIIVGGIAIIKSDAVYSRIVCAAIPNEMDAIENTGLIFYSERNKDFDSKTDGKDYFKMFKCYYYPENDKTQEKVYLDDGTYYQNDEPVFVSIGFLYMVNQNLAKLKTAVKIIVSLLVICAVALFVYFYLKSNKKGNKKRKKNNK